MSVTIYHNPRCSKSRQTLELLRENNVDPEIVEYLKTPPDMTTLQDILKRLGISAADLIRNKEAEYKELGLAAHKDDETKLLQAMIEHPKLIERPIVIANGKAVIGRPPENVLDIL